MKDDKVSYSEAIAEIEKIRASFNEDEFDVDTLAAKVKRATELIAVCREKLRKAENEVSEILKD